MDRVGLADRVGVLADLLAPDLVLEGRVFLADGCLSHGRRFYPRGANTAGGSVAMCTPLPFV